MKISILAEGSAKWQRFIKHWGLSVLIDGDILFDTFGKPEYVLKQLERSGFAPKGVRHIVISHDDWDHVSGLWKLLERSRGAAVYICPHCKPEIKARIKWYGARLIEVEGITDIRDGICLSGELMGKRRDCDIPEQYLAIKTVKGLIVLTGCAHPGIVEIVQHAKISFGQDVRLLIGGFHLKDNSNEANSGIVLKLKELGVRQVLPLHCTGRLAVEMFRRAYGNDCIVSGEGKTLEV